MYVYFLAIDGNGETGGYVRELDQFVRLDPDEFAVRRAIMFSEREMIFRDIATELQVFDDNFWSKYTIAIVPREKDCFSDFLEFRPAEHVPVRRSFLYEYFTKLCSLFSNRNTHFCAFFVATYIIACLNKRN